MADTRAVLIGTGVLLLVVGFFVSNLICGIGVLFIILGLVIWQREEYDTSDYSAKTSPAHARVRARRRRRAVLVVIIAVVVLVAGVAGYLLYLQPRTPEPFTGVRVTAPVDSCWSGTVGLGAPTNGIHVGGCGSQDVPLTCTVSMWANLTKSTPGNWTLSVAGYRNDQALGTDSDSSNLGTVRHTFVC